MDDLPIFYAAAILSGGVSYDAGTGDSLTLITAPANTVPMGVPIPFTVAALAPNLAPAGGLTVTYTVTGGAATLGCGLSVCPVSATGDGRASINITAIRYRPGCCSRLAQQWSQPAGTLHRRNSTHPHRAHSRTLRCRRLHGELDRPGPGAQQRRPHERAVRSLAIRIRHQRPRQQPRRFQQQRHRQPVHRRGSAR